MKILIVGASGYLGGCISNFLADVGHELICHFRTMPLNSSSWQSKMSKTIIGDIRNSETINKIANQKVDALIWTVSLNHKVSEKDIDQAMGVNVTPFWKVLDTISKISKKKVRIVYLSTQQVYGTLLNTNIIETNKTSPLNNYGLTHLMCENILRRFNNFEKLECLSLRLSNGYGSPAFSGCDCWWLVVNEFSKMAIENKRIDLLSDGSPNRDFIHVTDICRGIKILLETEPRKLKFIEYNLGSGRTISIIELAWIVAECYEETYGDKILIQIKGIPQDKSKNIITLKRDNQSYDLNRINALGFYPKTEIKDGIKDIFNYIEANF